MEKKPLYRKVSKTTHNGFPHADFDTKRRAKYARHTKEGMERGMSKRHDHNGYGEYDYTPLFKFLLKQEGRDWNEVWQECCQRLNTTEPVQYMVVNIYKNGLVNPNVEIYLSDEEKLDWKGRNLANDIYAAFRYGEGSSFSTMYVDEDNKLQFVDKNYVTGPNYEIERRWGETFNGHLYDCYKQSKQKTEKKKSYIKNKQNELHN